MHFLVQNILYFNIKVLSAVLTCTRRTLWGGSSHSLSSTLEWKPFIVFPRRASSGASSPSKAFLTSFEYLLKFWHHLSATSSQNTCHSSFQWDCLRSLALSSFWSQVCVCLFGSLKWLLLSVLWMHSAKVRCVWQPIKSSLRLMNTLALLMMGNRESLSTLNLWPAQRHPSRY